MRTSFFDFFKLKENYIFSIVLVSMSAFFVIFMWMQRLFGRCFYLPKALNPNFYDYKRKCEKLLNKEEKCPICFMELTESVEEES